MGLFCDAHASCLHFSPALRAGHGRWNSDQGQASNPLQVFTWVRTHRTISGQDVPAQAVEDAIRLWEEKHCSVGNDSQVECRTAHDVQDCAGVETGLDVA